MIYATFIRPLFDTGLLGSALLLFIQSLVLNLLLMEVLTSPTLNSYYNSQYFNGVVISFSWVLQVLRSFGLHLALHYLLLLA